MDPQPTLHIIDTTSLKSITYVLSLSHFTDTDTRCLTKILADTVSILID